MNYFMNGLIAGFAAQYIAQKEVEKCVQRMRLTEEQEEKLEAIKDVLDEEEYQMLRRRMMRENLEG